MVPGFVVLLERDHEVVVDFPVLSGLLPVTGKLRKGIGRLRAGQDIQRVV